MAATFLPQLEQLQQKNHFRKQMLKNEEGQIELYDLSNDIGEKINLVDEIPEIATEMRKELHNWYMEMGAQFTSLNENYKINK